MNKLYYKERNRNKYIQIIFTNMVTEIVQGNTCKCKDVWESKLKDRVTESDQAAQEKKRVI